jgi:26S proteasome regulatory subunit N1
LRLEDPGDTPQEATEKEENEKEGAEAKEQPVKVVIEGTNEELQALGIQCAKFLLGHNAEPDAVDLMEELEIVDQIAELADDNTYARVCIYDSVGCWR